MIELYEHNQEAYENMEEMFEYEDKVSIVHPTGTGKMYIAVKWLYENKDKPCLFLCPTNAVMYQLKETIEDNGLTLKDFPNLKLALYSHLLNWNTEDYKKEYECIVLDEFHRAGAQEWGRCVNTLLEYNEESKVLGLSATPTRYVDKKNMVDEIFEGNVASEITLAEAIARNILPFPHYVGCVYYLQEEINKREEMIKDCQDESKRSYLEKLIKEAKRHLENVEGMEEIIDEHIKEPGKYMVFCKDINHITEMKEEVKSWFKNIGEVKEYIVHSNIEKEENQETIKRFEEEDGCQLLFSVDMLTEGLHVKGVDGVIMLRTTNSHIVYLQQLGRSLKVKGKIPKVIDVANNIEAYENIYDVRDEILEYLGYEGYNDDRLPIELKEKFKVYGYTKDIVNILKQVDFMYRLVISFEEKIEILKEYLKKHKYSEIDYTTKYELKGILYPIGHWRSDWRNKYNKNELKEFEKQQLIVLGETFERKRLEKLNFGEKIEIIKRYLKNHEYSEIKDRTIYEQNNVIYPIGTWVSQWRNEYIKLKETEKQILCGLGETFKRKISVVLSFEQKLSILKEYLKNHEYLEIVERTTYEQDGRTYPIGVWLKTWREGRVKLSEEQEQILRCLGENFERKSSQKHNFEEKIEILKEYLKEHEYSEIIKSTTYELNGRVYLIGNWVNKYRKDYNKGKISKIEEQILRSLGEEFLPKKNVKKLKVNNIPIDNILIVDTIEGQVLDNKQKHR